MTTEQLLTSAGLLAVIAPLALLLLLGAPALVGRSLAEKTIGKLTQATVLVGLVSSLVVLATMLIADVRHVPVEVGTLVALPEAGFHLHLKFVFDRLSVPFLILTFVLVGATGAFASRYLHREPGYSRFFLLYAVFLLGMVVATVGGTIETLFFGWELVGLSSALLVAYFQRRREPVENGQRVWCVYRLADAAFLIAAVALHHVAGGGDFGEMSGEGVWPDGVAALSSSQALFVGSLLLIAAAGKSALVPFSGWLPRAMEGPTPSSAVFYGALSVHLGTYLLLRVCPILELSTTLSAMVVALGLVTAIYAAITASVQTDIKSALAYASLTQVGVITAEIGMGFRYIALIHIIGHASLRALQLLRAPSLLHDYHTIENAIGGHLNHEPGAWERKLPAGIRRRLYLLAHHRGELDSLLDRFVVAPFFRVFRGFDAFERSLADRLAGRSATQSGELSASVNTEEDAA